MNTSNQYNRQPPPPPSSFKPSSAVSSFEPPPINRSELASGSLLSNATTNMTNVTPLGGHDLSLLGGSGKLQYSSSDYENLSNTALNDILENYPNQSRSRAPLVADRAGGGVAASSRRPLPPPPPSRPPPPIYTAPSEAASEDQESMVSCQLITSASLLVNRDLVKEARHVTTQPQPQMHAHKNLPPTWVCTLY